MIKKLHPVLRPTHLPTHRARAFSSVISGSTKGKGSALIGTGDFFNESIARPELRYVIDRQLLEVLETGQGYEAWQKFYKHCVENNLKQIFVIPRTALEYLKRARRSPIEMRKQVSLPSHVFLVKEDNEIRPRKRSQYWFEHVCKDLLDESDRTEERKKFLQKNLREWMEHGLTCMGNMVMDDDYIDFAHYLVAAHNPLVERYMRNKEKMEIMERCCKWYGLEHTCEVRVVEPDGSYNDYSDLADGTVVIGAARTDSMNMCLLRPPEKQSLVITGHCSLCIV